MYLASWNSQMQFFDILCSFLSVAYSILFGDKLWITKQEYVPFVRKKFKVQEFPSPSVTVQCNLGEYFLLFQQCFGSVTFWYEYGCGSGSSDPYLCLTDPDADLEHWHKVITKSQNSRSQGFSYYFCLMMEGSGAGSILVTNGSGFTTLFFSKPVTILSFKLWGISNQIPGILHQT